MSGQSYGSVHHVAILATDLDESVGWHLTVLKAERESARRDAGANYPVLRSTGDTKNDNRFHGHKVINGGQMIASPSHSSKSKLATLVCGCRDVDDHD
jgi:hypothetical protein